MPLPEPEPEPDLLMGRPQEGLKRFDLFMVSGESLIHR